MSAPADPMVAVTAAKRVNPEVWNRVVGAVCRVTDRLCDRVEAKDSATDEELDKLAALKRLLEIIEAA